MDPGKFYGRTKYVEPAGPQNGAISDDDASSGGDDDVQPIVKRRTPRIFESDDSEDSEDIDGDVAAEFDIVLDQEPASPQNPARNSARIRSPEPPTHAVPVAPRPKPSKKKTPIRWTDGTLRWSKEDTFFTGSTNLPDYITELTTPYQFFNFVFDKELIQKIVEQTNLFSTQQRPEKLWSVSREEMEQFFGTVLFISLTQKPTTRDYWSSTHPVREVSEVMYLSRWEEIKRNLHFNDNGAFIPPGQDGHDKLHKVRPLVEHLRRAVLKVPKEKELSVDEQIIPFKGRSSLKQYNPKKPHKWGYKVFVLSGLTGFSYDFEIFTGSLDNKILVGEPDLGVSSNVVMRLARSIPRGVNHVVCCDNWFTSPALQVYLKQEGILSIGTVRQNRLQGCPLPPEKKLKKEGRGAFEEKVGVVDGVTLAATVWFDNKTVSLLSSYVGSEPVGEVERFFQSEKVKRKIRCPRVVSEYNSTMGGVDKLDSILGLYRIHVRFM